MYVNQREPTGPTPSGKEHKHIYRYYNVHVAEVLCINQTKNRTENFIQIVSRKQKTNFRERNLESGLL